MGDFRVEVNATGGHGCQRELGDPRPNPLPSEERSPTPPRRRPAQAEILRSSPSPMLEILEFLADLVAKQRGGF